jgi:SAM-dependent methyltransferase
MTVNSIAEAGVGQGGRTGEEVRLIEAMRPFQGFMLAGALQAFFASGLYDQLAAGETKTVAELAAAGELEEDRVEALARFLEVEGVIDYGTGVSLTERGRSFGDFRAWYEMLIGGYGHVVAGLADGLRRGGEAPPRTGVHVANGSAGVSMRCSLPMVQRLLAARAGEPELIVDVGCGSPRYLEAICASSGCHGIGIDPDLGAVEAGNAYLRGNGNGAVEMHRGRAQDGIVDLGVSPDVVIVAFVLHEVLGQSGEASVHELLLGLAAAAPDADLLIVEVDWRGDDPTAMQHGYSRTYYNGYYLLHPFTEQRLATKAFWDSTFDAVGLDIVAHETTDPRTDSTGLELGYLLRSRDAG